uniref:Allantoicase domain-containing protein n=1 Tax=Pseudo-nitzschia australis TaxID=44445 RepID=A0A7S4AJZ9_9STRA|mmetsp:Transcript_24581/g.53827  ORF Transcript_24581/g.53827 Transcript_24581/m.53827 type:complete len:502 (-) Transcript_24581:212-1717(-)|eukprot:CAMPEP_0168195372 /NCGR_PEP_ID=MMETSP0139_2-20121125/19802_1 /TAXON_ID=44445 /ORGANISM="Pseudo-nitzschia australis, Strain 10249 10 AB" /LENGTH=501 /DNA_ID=CAMNT_0008119185 /DNA_START=122 /DNA_END=1627 /DNA_ORIENTATION=+
MNSNATDALFSPAEDTTIDSGVNHLTRNPISATSVADFDFDSDFDPKLKPPEPCKNVAPRGPFADHYTNLASSTGGAKVLFATDDWFATAENLLDDGPPMFDPDAFCEQGKVLDGWETRRRRQAGHDWCLIKLSKRAEIFALELDTAHFTGNNVPKISLEICDVNASDLSETVAKLPGAYERLLHGGVRGMGRLPEEVDAASEALDNSGICKWRELLPTTPLAPGFETTRMHYFRLETPAKGNLVRVNYFPDGGVARFRCWGNSLGDVKPATSPLYMPIRTCDECTVVPHSSVSDPSELPSRQHTHQYQHQHQQHGGGQYRELSSLDEGGIGGACSNKHYGEPWRLIQPGLGTDMGDGWETARHPNRPGILERRPGSLLLNTPLSDWAILKLGCEGSSTGVAKIILDTKHFRGNFPESVAVEGCCCDPGEEGTTAAVDGYDPNEQGTGDWFTLIPRSRTSPDSEHVFERSKDQVRNADKPVTHVRVSIFPDGGLSRVRIYG